jgi:hypothetical protein
MELLFLIGLAWACSRGVEALRKPASARWAKYQKARQGTSPAQRAKARAARAAVGGFWAGEVFRGLPHARHGWAKGWNEHKLSRAEAERDHAGAVADHQSQIARVRAEMAAHKHRLEVARKQAAEPTMTDQLDAEKRRIAAGNGEHDMARGAGCTDPDCSCHASDPPLADGQTPGNGPASNGHKASNGQASSNGRSPSTTGGAVSDLNYDTTVEQCDEAISACEQGLDTGEVVNKITTMADELGQVIRNDSTAAGKAVDAASHLAAMQKERDQAMDALTGLKEHVVSNYGPVQETQDAAEGIAEADFVEH